VHTACIANVRNNVRCDDAQVLLSSALALLLMFLPEILLAAGGRAIAPPADEASVQRLHVAITGIPCTMVSHAPWYPMRHGIPCGMVSRAAWYPMRHGIPCGTVSRAARYPVVSHARMVSLQLHVAAAGERHGVECGMVVHTT
jgi:hypothetical protein